MGRELSLQRLILTGGRHLALRSLVLAALELVKAVVFSRILSPEDYGLFALALIPIGFAESFAPLGVELLVQRDGKDLAARLPTYWSLRLARGLLMFALLWITAPFFAEAYGRSELDPLVRILSFSFLLGAFQGFGREIRQRNLDYRRLATIDCLASGVSILAGLAALAFSVSAFALAVYHLASSLLALFSSYWLHPWRPALAWRNDVLRGVWAFAASIFLINALNYAFTAFDRGLVAEFLGTEELGYYARGHFLALLPVTLMTPVLSPLTLNSLRTIADEPARLQDGFRKFLFVTACAGAAGGLLMLLFSRPLLLLVYGERWLPALPVMQIMIVYGVTKTVSLVCPAIFYLHNRPGIIAGLTAAMVFALVLIGPPLTERHGIVGTAASVAISGAFSHLLAVGLAFRILGRAHRLQGGRQPRQVPVA